MRKYILAFLMFLGITSVVKAEPMDVDLGQMFNDYKDNEYAFKQKYSNKDLKFTALVSSVDANCYTDWNGNGTPCIKLEHKTYKVAYLHVIPTNIGKALMYDNKDLADLQKKQEITLICRLKSKEALLESDPLVFENCKLDGREYPADEKIKAEITNDNVNERNIIDSGSCGTNCAYEIDNKGFMLIKPIDNSTRADVRDNAFKERKDFTKVKIEEGVVSIGDGAFKFTNLTKINLPDTLTSIGSGKKYLGNGAFEQTKLKKIKIPDSITVINDNTFKWNDLKEVILPKNLKVIGDDAFNCWNNDKLKNIIIPDTVTSIGDEAFESCDLENLNLPESLETLGNYAFKETKIKTLKLPLSLKTIPHYAFAYTKISELVIPDSVIFIDDGAFREAKLSYLVISDTTEVSSEAFKDATIGIVYCRGDVDTCKENLEDALPEATGFVSLEELRVRQEAEARAKEEAEIRAKEEAEARAREEAEAQERLKAEQESNANSKGTTVEDKGINEFTLDNSLPTQTVDKNILLNAKLMKTITPEQLEEYIIKGADVNASDDKGTTVLMMAALSSTNPQILEILIDKGSAIESKRNNGWTPLTIAAKYNPNPKVIQTLLDKGAKISNRIQLLDLLDKNKNMEKNQDYWALKDRIYEKINK